MNKYFKDLKQISKYYYINTNLYLIFKWNLNNSTYDYLSYKKNLSTPIPEKQIIFFFLNLYSNINFNLLKEIKKYLILKNKFVNFITYFITWLTLVILLAYIIFDFKLYMLISSLISMWIFYMIILFFFWNYYKVKNSATKNKLAHDIKKFLIYENSFWLTKYKVCWDVDSKVNLYLFDYNFVDSKINDLDSKIDYIYNVYDISLEHDNKENYLKEDFAWKNDNINNYFKGINIDILKKIN